MLKNKLFWCKFNYIEQILSLGNDYIQQKYIWPVHLLNKLFIGHPNKVCLSMCMAVENFYYFALIALLIYLHWI